MYLLKWLIKLLKKPQTVTNRGDEMKWIKKLLIKRKIRIINQAISKLDEGMKKAGFKRHERRQIWRDMFKRCEIDSKYLIKMVQTGA